MSRKKDVKAKQTTRQLIGILSVQPPEAVSNRI